MTTRVHQIVAALLGGSALLSAAPLSAQQAGARSALEEVVVTARRREENLQDIPISVMALGSEALEARGIESMEDLNTAVPNIALFGGGSTGEADSDFTMRGIPGIATYVDGVWQATDAGLLSMNVVEVERIEVLRGPQGTLFGKNTTGGAIQYVTRLPGEEFGARVKLTTGSYDRRDVTAAVDIPLADNLLTKVTAAQLTRDGFVESIVTGRKFGDINDTVYRGDVLWTPTDSLQIRFIGEFTEVDRAGAARVVDFLNGHSRQQAFNDAGFAFTNETHASNWPGGIVGGHQTRSDMELQGYQYDSERFTVDVEWDLTDSLTLKSITGLRDYEDRIYTDWDAAEITLIEDDRRRIAEQFTQELQLQGQIGSRVDWVAGLYYWREEAATRTFRWTFTEFRTGELDLALAQAGQPGFALTPNNSDDYIGDETTGTAVFGEANIALTDRLQLTVGIRFNEEEAEDYDITPTGAVMPDMPDTNAVGDVFAGIKTVVGTADFDSTTPRVALDYRWNDNLMTYVSYAEGFGAGGINVNPVLGVVPYDAETLDNYEFGLRSDWLDDKIRFNFTWFKGKWDGIHVSEAPPDPNNPGLSLPNPITTNAGKAEVDGFEIETVFAPNEHWRFDVNVGRLDTKYTDVGTTTQIALDSPFKLAPELSYSVGAEYGTDLANGGTLVARLDYGFMDDYMLSEAIRQQRWQESFGLTNARVQYSPPSQNWRLSAFGTNLGDERYLNSGFLSGGFGIQAATVNRPREVGATLEFFFE